MPDLLLTQGVPRTLDFVPGPVVDGGDPRIGPLTWTATPPTGLVTLLPDVTTNPSGLRCLVRWAAPGTGTVQCVDATSAITATFTVTCRAGTITAASLTIEPIPPPLS